MKNGVFINCTALTGYAFKNLPSGKSAFQTVLDYSLRLPDAEDVFILCSGETEKNCLPLVRDSVTVVAREKWDSSVVFEVLSSYSGKFDNLFYIYGDCPFLDADTAERMYGKHLRYGAQYSFADGGPYGIAPEIIASEIAGALKVLSDREKLPLERDTVFTVIQRDINSFDIETDLCAKDLRMLRISLTADTKRNFLLLESLEREGITGEEKLVSIDLAKQGLLRTLPAYYQIQITDRCPQACTYCPYPAVNPSLLEGKTYMDRDKYRLLLEKISDFSDDAVISFSLWGEPSYHPGITQLIRDTLDYPQFSLLVETSGIGWEKGFFESLAGELDSSGKKDKLMWIVSLDTDNSEVYASLRGDGYHQALAAAEELSRLFPETAYIQSVRMNENDHVLEKFYKSWKASGKKMIVQKYDSFCGRLPDRKVTDISPLKRIPCWHIKRDFPVLLDGTVTLCREDLEKNLVLGNAFSDQFGKIWQAGEKYYLEQLEGKYNGICAGCDEYYTYNF